MKNDTLYNCSLCKKDYPRKKVQVINGVVKCKLCKQKKRLEKRESFKRNVFGVRKRVDIIKEQKEKRKIKRAEKEVTRQAIKEERERKRRNKPVKSNLLPIKEKIRTFSYLSLEEKRLLYKKYLKQGYNPETSNLKIKKCVDYMTNLREKLRMNKVPEEKILNRFKEEFAKLIMED